MKPTLLDSLKLAWFHFARSRGWRSKVTLSTGLTMAGRNKTIHIQSPIYKFSERGVYETNKKEEDNAAKD